MHKCYFEPTLNNIFLSYYRNNYFSYIILIFIYFQATIFPLKIQQKVDKHLEISMN